MHERARARVRIFVSKFVDRVDARIHIESFIPERSVGRDCNKNDVHACIHKPISSHTHRELRSDGRNVYLVYHDLYTLIVGVESSPSHSEHMHTNDNIPYTITKIKNEITMKEFDFY